MRPYELQNARLRCPLLSWSLLRFMSIELVVLSNHLILCLLQKDPFSFCLQSSIASGSFPMCWLFSSGGQNIGASASALVLTMNIQGWFPLGLTDWISLQSKGLSKAIILLIFLRCLEIPKFILMCLYFLCPAQWESTSLHNKARK